MTYRIGRQMKNKIFLMEKDSMIFRSPEDYPEYTEWFKTASLVRARRVGARWPMGTVQVLAYDDPKPQPKQHLEQPALF